jgi:hypothetical protein
MNKPWNPWGFQPQIWWFMVIMYENLGWKTDGYKPWKMMESMRIEKPHFHGDWIIKYGDLSIKSRDGTRKKKSDWSWFLSPKNSVYLSYVYTIRILYVWFHMCLLCIYIYHYNYIYHYISYLLYMAPPLPIWAGGWTIQLLNRPGMVQGCEGSCVWLKL